MAEVLEKGGGSAAPAAAPAAATPPYEETYDEYLARQYAEGNVYSTGTSDASNYAYGQAAVNNAAPPPAGSGLPTQQQTLDYYGSQSINDYGPPPQPQYAATSVGKETIAPATPPPLPDWASPLTKPGARDVVKALPMGGLIDAALNTSFSNYAQEPATVPAPTDFQVPPPGWYGTRLPQPPGWQPGTVAPYSDTWFRANGGPNPNALAAAGQFIERYDTGYDPSYRAYRASLTPQDRATLNAINVARARQGLPPIYSLPGDEIAR